MKLESSAEFLLDSDLKEYVYVYVYKPSQAITISKMVLLLVHTGIVLDCYENVQFKKFEKKHRVWVVYNSSVVRWWQRYKDAVGNLKLF